jgi:hypothetical protein
MLKQGKRLSVIDSTSGGTKPPAMPGEDRIARRMAILRSTVDRVSGVRGADEQS